MTRRCNIVSFLSTVIRNVRVLWALADVVAMATVSHAPVTRLPSIVSALSRAAQSLDSMTVMKLEMWAMPNVMADLPNIGGALCSTPQSLANARCQDAKPVEICRGAQN